MCEDCVVEVQCLEDELQQVTSSTIDYLYVKELFEWITFETSDWEAVSGGYRLVIPFNKHKCVEPFVDSMVITENDSEIKYQPNLATWSVLSNDSIVITSDEPINCKVLIKGDR